MMGAVAWTGEDIALRKIRFEQENASGGGRATLELVEPRPRIEGTFVVDQLNLGILTYDPAAYYQTVKEGPRSKRGERLDKIMEALGKK